MNETVTLYVTTESEEEAEAIARKLVAERLVACANLLPRGRSIYRWEGEIVEEGESYMLLKTTAARADAAIARIRELHSFEVPCIAVWSWAGGLAAYAAWVAEETRMPT